MKYILIENGEGPKRMRIFDSAEERAIATRSAIIGPPDEDNRLMDCPEIMQLSEDGFVTFEGDPGLEWINAEVDSITNMQAILNRIYAVASGEEQVSDNDADGMKWIANLVEPYVTLDKKP